MTPKTDKRQLIEFLVDVQKTVLDLKKNIKDIKYKEEKNRREYFLFLIDVLENFDNLRSVISVNEGMLDKRSLQVLKSYDMIYRKISNHLDSQDVQKIDLDDNNAKIEYCEVVDSVEVDDPLLKGKVKDIVNHGYTHSGKVLKCTRVITYR